MNGVDFDMFVLMQSAVISQQALLQAVKVCSFLCTHTVTWLHSLINVQENGESYAAVNFAPSFKVFGSSAEGFPAGGAAGIAIVAAVVLLTAVIIIVLLVY